MSHNKNTPLAEIAKMAVENYIEGEKIISPPPNSPKEFLDRKAGVFVTINKEKNLRACIGTYLPTKENIVEETISSAIAAATNDWRFGPIRREELPHLEYEISVLSEPEQIKEISELNPKKYGVIVQGAENSFRKGLLLPDIEGIKNIEKQIAIAAQKGGINLEKEKIIIYKFSVEKYN